MIGPLISAVAIVFGWITGLLADTAAFFGSVASACESIPIVGPTLASLFRDVRNAFYDLRYDTVTFSYRLQNVLYAIDSWLDDLADLIGDVHGWIMDRIDDAYSWATNAWDWIVATGTDLVNDVYGWIMDKLDLAYTVARNALNWVIDTGQDLWNDVYGWISDKLNDAYAWASGAWAWIQDFPSHVSEFLGPLKDAILQTIAPYINLVSFFFDDINLFFSDPPAYFRKKVDEGPLSLAEALWAVVERILERIW